MEAILGHMLGTILGTVWQIFGGYLGPIVGTIYQYSPSIHGRYSWEYALELQVGAMLELQ